jgi:hypothetical protein
VCGFRFFSKSKFTQPRRCAGFGLVRSARTRSSLVCRRLGACGRHHVPSICAEPPFRTILGHNIRPSPVHVRAAAAILGRTGPIAARGALTSAWRCEIYICAPGGSAEAADRLGRPAPAVCSDSTNRSHRHSRNRHSRNRHHRRPPWPAARALRECRHSPCRRRGMSLN